MKSYVSIFLLHTILRKPGRKELTDCSTSQLIQVRFALAIETFSNCVNFQMDCFQFICEIADSDILNCEIESWIQNYLKCGWIISIPEIQSEYLILAE